MNKRFRFLMLIPVIMFVLALAACRLVPAPPPAVPPPPPTETPVPEIGTPRHPIRMLFSPSADTNATITGARIMTDAISKATALTFVVSLPTSHAAAIEEMCASPADTIGFLPALPYVLANQMCGVDVAFKATRSGYDVFWAEILVPRHSDIDSLDDLNGKKWGYGDPGFASDYLVPLVMFTEAGVKPGEQVQISGHGKSVQALYNGEVDFVTTFYSPPTDVNSGETVWSEEAYDIPEGLVESCAVTNDGGAIVCGSLKVHDARAIIRASAPDVIQKLRILAISPDIPNDTLSFSPKFPPDLRSQIEEALAAFANSAAWDQSVGSQDFYNWTGIAPARDSEYDLIRTMLETTWPDLGILKP